MKTARDIHSSLVASGMTSLEAAKLIAEKMGVSHETVYGWIGKRFPSETSNHGRKTLTRLNKAF